MNKPLRVVHYINQFFGQIGGEEQAGTGISLRDGPIGPGLALQAALTAAGMDAQVIGTAIAGDTFMAEKIDERAAQVVTAIKSLAPDILIAGPAFAAGRYGLACGAVCAEAEKKLRIPTVSAMFEENPGVGLYRSRIHIVPTGGSVASMRKAMADMATVANALSHAESPAMGLYYTQGIRTLVNTGRTGAERAVSMLVARLSSAEGHESELPLPSFDKVTPAAPLKSLKDTIIILVTEGGLIPEGNPDGIEMSMATRFGTYSIEDVHSFDPEKWTVAHGGYDNTAARQNPNRLMPLDAMRHWEKQGLCTLGERIYTTAGNATSLNNAQKFGAAIAEDIRKQFKGKVGVILTST